MIAVDASAVVAILLAEPEADALMAALLANPAVMSPISYWEAALSARRSLGVLGQAELDELLSQLRIVIQPADEMTARSAVQAAVLYGKKSPAKLNLGDCFSYALAKECGGALLFKGEDFIHTDIEAVITA